MQVSKNKLKMYQPKQNMEMGLKKIFGRVRFSHSTIFYLILILILDRQTNKEKAI